MSLRKQAVFSVWIIWACFGTASLLLVARAVWPG